MFSTEGTSKIFDQVADLVRYRDHFVHAFLVFEANHRSYVQTTNTGVPVVGCFSLMVPDDLIEPTDKVSHFSWVNSSVFYKRQWLSIAVHTHQQTQALFAHCPNASLTRTIQHVHSGIAVTQAGHIVFQLGCLIRQFNFSLSVELHYQNCTGRSFNERHVTS